jgi:hypothetical protein
MKLHLANLFVITVDKIAADCVLKMTIDTMSLEKLKVDINCNKRRGYIR